MKSADVVGAWLEEVGGRVQAKTLQSYRSIGRQLASHLEERGVDLGEVTREILGAWLGACHTAGESHHTTRYREALVRQIMKWAKGAGYIPSNPLERHYAFSTLPPAIARLVDGWIRYLEARHFSPLTISVYRGKIKAFLGHLAERKTAPESIDFRFLERWIHGQFEAQDSAKTIKDRVVAVKCFYRWLRREGKVSGNPCQDLDPIKQAKTLPEFWSEEQVQRILAAAETIRNRAILHTLYSTGGRASEVIGLELKDVSLEKGTAKVFGKGRKERLVFLSPPAVQAIRDWLPQRSRVLERAGRPPEEALFVSSRGRPMSYMPFREVVVRAAALAGIPGEAHPHMFRHSIATHLLDRGMDLRHVQEMLGHESITSTTIYTHVAREKLVSELQRAHPGCEAPKAPPAAARAPKRFRAV